MTNFKFSPSDFKCHSHGSSMGPTWPELAADVANAKLAEFLATGVKVYGRNDGHWNPLGWFSVEGHATHEALLVCIKPIERECSHPHQAIDSRYEKDIGVTANCKLCGKRLKATWSVVDE